ncbi:MAG: YsnF/AvaK domain-containing protein [Bacteroidota bacterium]|nr:YsnF/AvaK domain-containing protein [Bacteroidota bacterium]
MGFNDEILKVDQNSQENIANDKNVKSLEVIEEEVVISKKLIETGKVKISKKVNEYQQLVNTSLIHEEIDIKTIPINKYIETAPEPIRHEGDTMIIPVIKEVVVVRIMLVEEIHITKKKVPTNDSQTISLSKEEIVIEREISGEK